MLIQSSNNFVTWDSTNEKRTEREGEKLYFFKWYPIEIVSIYSGETEESWNSDDISVNMTNN
jgi:hypothetical protein